MQPPHTLDAFPDTVQNVMSLVDHGAQHAWACVQTWKRICEASRNEFYAIYERLDVRLLWRGESYYNPQLRPLVEELQERGIAEESEGALVSFGH